MRDDVTYILVDNLRACHTERKFLMGRSSKVPKKFCMSHALSYILS